MVTFVQVPSSPRVAVAGVVQLMRVLSLQIQWELWIPWNVDLWSSLPSMAQAWMRASC
jgi:hypothetical protein